MIRGTTLILASLVATACTSLPGLDIPELTIKPQYHTLKLSGRTRMQSPSSVPGTNAAMNLTTLGTRKRDDDYGGVLAYGDGFSGLEFGYLKVDMDSTDRGASTAEWGTIPSGTTVTSKFLMDEYKLTYIGQIYEYESDDELLLRFGVGATLAHREASFTVQEDGTALAQKIRFKDDGVPYAAARLRGEYRAATLTFDYAYTDVNFGGEFDGRMQDYAITGSYTLVDQDITFLAGYRWLELPASGTANSLAFDNDISLDGYVFGVEVRF